MYGASMLFFFAALEHLDVTVASVSLYLVPIFGVLLAAVLLGERLSTLALVGSGIVLRSDASDREVRHELLNMHATSLCCCVTDCRLCSGRGAVPDYLDR